MPVKTLIDDEPRSVSPDTVNKESPEPEQEGDLEQLRKKFVGEIELPESECYL
jgi:ribonucleoside-diphosphate reductase subunit M2